MIEGQTIHPAGARKVVIFLFSVDAQSVFVLPVGRGNRDRCYIEKSRPRQDEIGGINSGQAEGIRNQCGMVGDTSVAVHGEAMRAPR